MASDIPEAADTGPLPDQKMWSLRRCASTFVESFNELKVCVMGAAAGGFCERLCVLAECLQRASSGGALEFDKDDDSSMDFVVAAGAGAIVLMLHGFFDVCHPSRSKSSGEEFRHSCTGACIGTLTHTRTHTREHVSLHQCINGPQNRPWLTLHFCTQTRFDAQSMAGNIIPAIATANAVIASLQVLNAIHVLAGEIEQCRTVYKCAGTPRTLRFGCVRGVIALFVCQLVRGYGAAPQGRRKLVLNSVRPFPPHRECLVCGCGSANVVLNVEKSSLAFFLDVVCGYLFAGWACARMCNSSCGHRF